MSGNININKRSTERKDICAQLFLCCNNATDAAADQYDQVVPGCCGSVRFLHMLLRSQLVKRPYVSFLRTSIIQSNKQTQQIAE